jgi:CYTH domain-containing protein
VIEKFRYEISFKNHLWEVDVFTGKLEGLYLAEIELNSEDEHFELPDWVGEEVSTDPNYYNSNLINKV